MGDPSLKEISQKIGWSALLQFNTLLIAPIFSIFLARYYSPAAFSSYFLSYGLLTLCSIPLSSILAKNIAFYQVKSANQLRLYDLFFLLSSVVLILLFLVIHLYYSFQELEYLSITLLLFPLVILMRGLKSLPNGLIDRDGDFKLRAIINGFSALASILVCTLLIFSQVVPGIVILCINVFLSEAISCYFYRRTLKVGLFAHSAIEEGERIDFSNWYSRLVELLRLHRSYLIFNFKTQSIYQVSHQADRLLVNFFSAGAAAGAYTKFINLSMIIPKTVSGVINRVNFSFLVQKRLARSKENMLFLVSSGLLFLGALILILFARPLVGLALGEQWLTHVIYLKLSVPVAFLFGINAYMNNHFVAKGNGKVVINRALIVNSIRLVGLGLIFYWGASIHNIFYVLLGVQLLNFFIYAYFWRNFKLLAVISSLIVFIIYLGFYA